MSNRRGDDGSQEWFDSVQQQRMHQRRSPNQKANQSYLDQRVGPRHQQHQQEQVEISDPYIKNIVDGYKTQPHYGPAHLGGKVVEKSVAANFEVEVDMSTLQNQMIQKQMEFQRQSGNQGFTVDEELMKLPPHLRQQFMPLTQGQMPQQQMQQNQTNQPQNQSIMLKEGYPVYRPIQQSFGNTMILAREIGVINHQLSNQQFIMRGARNAYVIPQNQTSVNIQEIQNNPRMLTQLVEIQGSPMSGLGSLLVLRESITTQANSYPGGRQVITDATQYQYGGGRTILKG